MMKAVAIGVLAGAVLLVGACGSDSTPDQTGSCGPFPESLVPPGSGQAAFTMGIRVNQFPDVKAMKTELGPYIRDRDVFVVNTQHPRTSENRQKLMIHTLATEFPCNRIYSLNGLGANPKQPSYTFALAEHPDVDGILVDWEQTSFADAGKGKWSSSLKQNLPRIATNLRRLDNRLASTDTKIGLSPQYVRSWDYGRTANVLAQINLERNRTDFGAQIVQTQPTCGDPDSPGPEMATLSKKLIREYRAVIGEKAKNGKPITPLLLRHLGLQISFSTHPNRNAPKTMPVLRLGPKQAARCTKEVLDAGGLAILYWAKSDAVRAMFKTPVGRTLRPAGSA
jgi:hypothetical protein